MSRFKILLKENLSNIYDWFVLIFSGVTIALTFFDIISIKYINLAILTVLTLLSIHFLLEHYQREKFEKMLSTESTWNDIDNKFYDDIQDAKNIKILGISPIGVFQRYEDKIKSILARHNGKIELICLDPDGDAIKLVGKVHQYNERDAGDLCNFLKKYFKEYLENKKLEVTLIDYVPSCILSIIDNRLIYATIYSCDQLDPKRPAEIVTSKERKKFSFFLKEFERLGKIGKPLTI
ncbi:MAG: hypothetical protein ABIF87_14860 [Pseudomonadota bacterium]